MALTVVPFSDDQVSLGETESAFELLTKNTLTTAGVLVAAGTGVAGAAVLTAALPAGGCCSYCPVASSTLATVKLRVCLSTLSIRKATRRSLPSTTVSHSLLLPYLLHT